MTVILALALAFCFERAHMIIAAPNYGSAWNGFGAIQLTYERKTKAPMAYRVLMPFFVIAVERAFHLPLKRRIDIYQAGKVLLTALAFYAVGLAWSPLVAAVTCVLMLLTVRFDYWSYAGELAGIALACTGDPALAVLGVFVHGLSKETAPVAPVAYLLTTGDGYGAGALMILTAAVMGSVRLIVGKRPGYTSLNKLAENWKRLTARDGGRLILFLYQPAVYSDLALALIVSILTLTTVLTFPPGWIIPLVILGAGWTLALADEVRVFTAVLPWIAAWMIGL
jgi:hypothetical protein